jgi:hypothetical protein
MLRIISTLVMIATIWVLVGCSTSAEKQRAIVQKDISDSLARIEADNKTIEANHKAIEEAQYETALIEEKDPKKKAAMMAKRDTKAGLPPNRYHEAMVLVAIQPPIRWHKEADVMMIATFVIRNDSDHDVKDIEIKCDNSGSSGTVMESNTKTVYQGFLAHKTRTISGFNMGFINSQATRSGCGITNLSLQ